MIDPGRQTSPHPRVPARARKAPGHLGAPAHAGAVGGAPGTDKALRARDTAGEVLRPMENMEVRRWEACRPACVAHAYPSHSGKPVPGGTLPVSSPGISPRSQTDCMSGRGALHEGPDQHVGRDEGDRDGGAPQRLERVAIREHTRLRRGWVRAGSARAAGRWRSSCAVGPERDEERTEQDRIQADQPRDGRRTRPRPDRTLVVALQDRDLPAGLALEDVRPPHREAAVRVQLLERVEPVVRPSSRLQTPSVRTCS